MHVSERLPLPPDTTCPQLHLSIENKSKLLIFRNTQNEKTPSPKAFFNLKSLRNL